MRDSEVVAAIVAGDPEGLAEAYDRYASPLYTYCRSLLREPADAADAVQDTFVIAASRLAGLRDQNRLRPWLYAVARNECLRRLRARAAQVATPVDDMPDVSDTTADVTGEVEREDLRALLRSAIRGLNTGDQDLIELQLRQGLDVAEVAAVLGVSRNHAHALLSRARDQLEISLGALLVARSGREDCAALDTMLQDWDGQLTILMRKRINRHIERCPVCAEAKKRELAPAMLLGLGPLLALPIAAMPPGLRSQVLRLASSNSPEAAAHRASVAQRVGPFGHQGFPKPLDPPKGPWWRPGKGQLAAAGIAAAAVVAATLIGVALASGGPGHHNVAADIATTSAPGSSAIATTSSGSPSSTGSPKHKAVHPTTSASTPAAPTPAAGGQPTPASSSPSSSPKPTHSSSPKPTKTSPKPSSPAPSKSTTPPPPPPPVTLSVSATTVTLSPTAPTGSFILMASATGSKVVWSITEGSGLTQVTVAPLAGSLSAGVSQTISLTLSNPLAGGKPGANSSLVVTSGTLTISPGGIVVTVNIVVGANGIPGALGPASLPGRPALAGRLVD
jgi:RNA polymerase sigma factor (sigma-70 family)